jgi:hypothetical protein
VSGGSPDAHTPARWALLVMLGGLVVGGARWWVGRRAESLTPAAGGSAPAAVSAPLECPSEQLSDDGVCVPAPPPEEHRAEPESTIGLLPGRNADPAAYVTPIASRPAALASEGLGLFIAAPPGVPVTAIALEGQTGPTRRWVTASTPPRLLTLHAVERGGSLRAYVLTYEGLSFDAASGRTELEIGTPLGRVAARPGSSGLGLTVYQLRRGVDADSLAPERLLTPSASLACDARNVLPAKPAP